MLSLDNNENILYKEDDIVNPGSICLNKNHTSVFFEDDFGGISGFTVDGIVMGMTGYSAKEDLKSSKNYSDTSRNNVVNTQKVNRISYIDKENIVVIAVPRKNIIRYLNNNGQLKKMIGSGKPDFALSGNIFNMAFNMPTSLVYWNKQDKLLIVDSNNHVVRTFRKDGEWKERETIGIPLSEGHLDDKISQAKFSCPSEVCCFENNVFVVDGSGTRVRKVDMDGVTTVYQTNDIIKSISCDSDNLYVLEYSEK